jgi:hypothetical protein
MKRNVCITTLVGLGISLACLLVGADKDGPTADRSLPAGACDIAGSWVSTSPAIPGVYANPLVAGAVVAPTDVSRQEFTAVVKAMNAEPTLGGMFADADSWVDSVTTFVRSGPRNYQFTQLGYAVKSLYPTHVFDRGQILYFAVFSGTAKFLAANTVKMTGTFSMYSNIDRPELIVPPLGINGVHDQDKDDDGLADPGEVPFLSLPFEVTMKRLP